MTTQPQVVIVGGGMITHDQLLPSLYHMLRQGRGRILSAASGSTRLGSQGLTAYAAAKAGIVGMTRTWAREPRHAPTRRRA